MGGVLQRVSEPADNELDLIVQKTVSLEVVAYLFHSNRQNLPIAEVQITVGGIAVHIGGGQALE